MIIDPSRRLLVIVGLACAVMVGMVGCGSPSSTTAPAATGAAGTTQTTPTPAGGGPDFTSVGFSTGGSGCTLGDAASRFAVGVPIHTVLTMSPALPTGGSVTVTVEKNGSELVEARQTITLSEPAPCIWGTLPDLEAGHYRLTYAITPSAMPPVKGEFDVTP